MWNVWNTYVTEAGGEYSQYDNSYMFLDVILLEACCNEKIKAAELILIY